MSPETQSVKRVQQRVAVFKVKHRCKRTIVMAIWSYNHGFLFLDRGRKLFRIAAIYELGCRIIKEALPTKKNVCGSILSTEQRQS